MQKRLFQNKHLYRELQLIEEKTICRQTSCFKIQDIYRPTSCMERKQQCTVNPAVTKYKYRNDKPAVS